MLCSECGKNQATIHTMHYVNGTKSEMHLCAECAKKHPELEMSLGGLNFGPQDLFKKFFDFGSEEPPVLGNSKTVCHTCGSTLRDFQKSGLLGCPDCYEVFSDRIIPVLQRAHGNTQHVGETPAGADPRAARRSELQTLQAQLSEAIQKEAFEQAAELRDRINALKQEDA